MSNPYRDLPRWTDAPEPPRDADARALSRGYTLRYYTVSQQQYSDELLLAKLESDALDEVVSELAEAARRGVPSGLDITSLPGPRSRTQLVSPILSELFFPDNHAKQPGYAIAARKLMTELHASGLLAAPR